MVVELLKFQDQLLGDDVGARGQDLSDFDIEGSEVFEHASDLAGALLPGGQLCFLRTGAVAERARDFGPEQATQGGDQETQAVFAHLATILMRTLTNWVVVSEVQCLRASRETIAVNVCEHGGTSHSCRKTGWRVSPIRWTVSPYPSDQTRSSNWADKPT
jgi:hypothetical protein